MGNPILALLVVYVSIESSLALFSMQGGLQYFCTKVKYISTTGTAILIGHLVYVDASNKTVYAFVIVTLVFTVLPRTIWRLRDLGYIPKEDNMEFLSGVALGAAFSKFWIAGWDYVKAYIPFTKK